jgi:subtilisin
LEGIEWAVVNGCSVVSMSLGAQGPVSIAYETAGQRALDAGTLVIAAAGNESTRPGFIAPVGRPANSVSVLAIAALDEALNIAGFSNGGTLDDGGQIDLAGPGVRIFSAAPHQTGLVRKSGTSMATPHVAGLAALYAQAFPASRGLALKALLLQNAKRLSLPSTDVGSGLVQAPQP